MCYIFHIEGLWFPFHSLWPTASVIRKPINQYAENKNQPWVQTLEVQCIPSPLVLVHWRKLLLLDKPSEQTIKNMNSKVSVSAKLHRVMMMMKKLTQTWWTMMNLQPHGGLWICASNSETHSTSTKHQRFEEWTICSLLQELRGLCEIAPG